jgi:hypothetical protein
VYFSFTGNALRLHYKHQPINAVCSENQLNSINKTRGKNADISFRQSKWYIQLLTEEFAADLGSGLC